MIVLAFLQVSMNRHHCSQVIPIMIDSPNPLSHFRIQTQVKRAQSKGERSGERPVLPAIRSRLHIVGNWNVHRQWVLSQIVAQTGSCKQVYPSMENRPRGTICSPGPCCDEELFLSCQATTVVMNVAYQRTPVTLQWGQGRLNSSCKSRYSIWWDRWWWGVRLEFMMVGVARRAR